MAQGAQGAAASFKSGTLLNTVVNGLKQLVTLDGAPEPETPQELMERLVNGGRSIKSMYDSIVQESKAKQRQELMSTANYGGQVRDAADLVDGTHVAPAAPAAPVAPVASAGPITVLP